MAIAVLIGLLCGLFAVAEPLNHAYWNVRFKVGEVRAPDSIIVLSIAQDTANKNNPTWSTRQQAHLLELLRRQMPHKVYFDSKVDSGADPAADSSLAEVVKSFGGDLAFVVRGAKNGNFTAQNFEFPPDSIVGHAPIVVSDWHTNFLDFALDTPYTVDIGDRSYPTLASSVSGVRSGLQRFYAFDPSMAPESVRTITAKQFIQGDFEPGLLTGRTVIVSSEDHSSELGYFGHGRVAPVVVDISGAQELKKPIPYVLGWIPLFLLSSVIIFFASRASRRLVRRGLYVLALAAVLLLPIVLQFAGIVSAPEVALVTIIVYGVGRLWQKWRKRVQHTSRSGLPNMLALTERSLPTGHDVVVGVIARYDEFLATLPSSLHGECAQQIARRLSIGSGCSEIYHGEGGHFAWLDEARPLETQLNHLEGLRALFSAPLQIGEHTFDTNIHFGLDRNEGLDALARLNSALASASEALKNGRTAEYFEAARLAEAPWELSLHARIDEGLRNGDIWLAYQPQWDYRENRIAGAEALIRWNHPTRGPIQPDAFILQAERAGRIDTLTYWVLEQAITSAETMNSFGERFQMSINLSAQMVDKPSLVSSISEIVRRRGIDCRLLTIEVTETSSVHNRPAARHNLGQLRSMGFRLSIDDFGTGEASLSYLAELPSDELKLDRRFVAAITSSDRNRKIVSSTIGLAHSLGQVVVAEGIEDIATFNLLRELNCDQGQGYFIGRPQPFAQLRDHYAGMVRRDGSTESETFRDC
ncbi:EAL domain-containing protein [Novosphingobium sp. ZN18A2]|uniref:EAL domain-containing protein n=1 Tax=Novosphingobium sp. ZN18A2 TaxID=3079861 RepID=UPI0030D5B526